MLGSNEGVGVGIIVASIDGPALGTKDGFVVGEILGTKDGIFEGGADGFVVKMTNGKPLKVLVDKSEGSFVGRRVGLIFKTKLG